MRLFIPPKGAMQFEVNPHGRPVVKRRVVEKPKGATVPGVIWVMPPVPNQGGCGCKVEYPIVREALPEPWRTAAFNAPFTVVTCDCQGKIIE